MTEFEQFINEEIAWQQKRIAELGTKNLKKARIRMKLIDSLVMAKACWMDLYYFEGNEEE